MIFIHKTRNISNLNKFQDDAIALISKVICVIKFNDDDLRFTLSEELTAQEEQDLDDLVNNFSDNDVELQVPKIISIAKAEAKSKHFHNIDYKKELTSSLIPKRTALQGEIVKVDWYKSLDQDGNPTDLVLTVDIVYTRDESGFATYRTTTRTWINEDGSENDDKKITLKYYYVNHSEMIDEGVKRRGLLVSNIKLPVLTFMSEALMPLGYTEESVLLKGRDFLDDYELEFNKFVDNSSSINDPASPDFLLKSVVVRIRDDQTPAYLEWLDKAPPSLGGTTTIRQYLMNEFSI